jgi:type I restriction enzyme S subunit
LKGEIHELIINSFEDRNHANDLIDKAEKLLIEELKLPPIQEMQPNFFYKSAELQNYQIKLSELGYRLDASYHIPLVNSITKEIKKTSREVTILSDNRISQKIILPGRFKRIYVEEEEGTVFIGGKHIYELDPTHKKYLSLSHHNKRIKDQLYLLENMIVVTCSGTIGRVNIIPKHWENWTMNQHVLRIIPQSNEIAGYIYIWLNTDYGYYLITRFTHGAVVDEINDDQLGQVKIPLLRNLDKQEEINILSLKANKLRYEAYLKEQQAIKMVNEYVIHASKEKLSVAAEPKVKFGRNKK